MVTKLEMFYRICGENRTHFRPFEEFDAIQQYDGREGSEENRIRIREIVDDPMAQDGRAKLSLVVDSDAEDNVGRGVELLVLVLLADGAPVVVVASATGAAGTALLDVGATPLSCDGAVDVDDDGNAVELVLLLVRVSFDNGAGCSDDNAGRTFKYHSENTGLPTADNPTPILMRSR